MNHPSLSLLLALFAGGVLGSTVHTALAQDETPCPPPVECPPCPACLPAPGPTPEQVQAVEKALQAITAAEVLEPVEGVEAVIPSQGPAAAPER